MKTCPTCGARAFDDAEVCYGCLHRYEKGECRSESGPGVQSAHRKPAPHGSVAATCPVIRPEVVSLGAASPPVPPVPHVVAPPMDTTGWVVRFELPGYAPMLETGEQEGGLVVRFRPETARESGDHRRVCEARGTHARDAPPTDGRVLVGATGRS